MQREDGILDFQADAAKITNICGVEQLSLLFNQIQRKINSSIVEREHIVQTQTLVHPG